MLRGRRSLTLPNRETLLECQVFDPYFVTVNRMDDEEFTIHRI